MNVTATLNLDSNDEAEIAAILACQPNQLNAKLNELTAAAVKEYLTMIRGQKVFKRGTDMHEYRLFLLIESIFGGRIPDESSVSSLFQTTITESRSLIRAVISKYQYQLRACIDATIVAALNAATRGANTDPYSVVINSQNLVDELNKMLAEIDGNLASVAKRRGSVSTYEVSASSYNRLCARLGIQPNP
jgi:predicted transcriptional regulator